MTWGITAVVGVGAAVGGYGAYTQGKAADAGAKAVEDSSAAQLEFQKEQAEIAQNNYEISRLEEQKRYGDWTVKDEERYDYLISTEKTRYDDMQAKDKERYDEQWGYFKSLTKQEQDNYIAEKKSADDRYNDEMDRIKDYDLEAKEKYLRDVARIDGLDQEEQDRYEAYTIEDKIRYAAEVARVNLVMDKQEEIYQEMNEIDQERYLAKKDRILALDAEGIKQYEELNAEGKERYLDALDVTKDIIRTEKERQGIYDVKEGERYDYDKQELKRQHDLAIARDDVRFTKLNEQQKTDYQSLREDERGRYLDNVLKKEQMFEKGEELVKPFLTSAEEAQNQLNVELGLAPGEAGTAYMETPGYKAALDERTKAVEQTAASMGEAYSGRRLEAAAKAGSDVQTQYYTNYMNMLGAQANPETAVTLASLGINQPQTQGNLPGMYSPYTGETNIQSGSVGSGDLSTGTPGANQRVDMGDLVKGDIGAGGPLDQGDPYSYNPASAGGYGTGDQSMGDPGGGRSYDTSTPYVGTPNYSGPPVPRPGMAPPSGGAPGYSTPPSGASGYTSPPGGYTPPSVGGHITDSAYRAGDLRTEGAGYIPGYLTDLAGMGANIYAGYQYGGGGQTPPRPTPTTIEV